MAIFYTGTGSFGEVDISGSASNIVNIMGSGSSIFTISGSAGGLLDIGDIGPSGDVFTVASASINILNIKNTPSVVISGSLAVTGPIIGTAAINVSAGTLSSNVSNLVFSNANGVSFGLDGNTITATAAGGAGGNVTLSYFNPNDGYVQVATQIGQSSLFFQPAQFPNVQFDRAAIPINYSNATNSSGTVTISMYLGLYTRNASTLSLASTISTAQVITNSGTVGSYTNVSGLRLFTIPFTGTITEGQYYVGFLSRTSAAAGTATISNFVVSQINSNFLGIFGVGSATSAQYTRGLGVFTAQTAALPASVAFSQINGTNSTQIRPPIFYVVSQTF